MEPASDTDTFQLSEQHTPVFWTTSPARSAISAILATSNPRDGCSRVSAQKKEGWQTMIGQ